MSSEEKTQVIELSGSLDASQAKVAIVASRFNSFIVERLIEGAVDVLRRVGGAPESITIVRCPGAFELPAVTRRCVESKKFDAVICLCQGAFGLMTANGDDERVLTVGDGPPRLGLHRRRRGENAREPLPRGRREACQRIDHGCSLPPPTDKPPGRHWPDGHKPRADAGGCRRLRRGQGRFCGTRSAGACTIWA